jgi:hypothetical protein
MAGEVARFIETPATGQTKRREAGSAPLGFARALTYKDRRSAARQPKTEAEPSMTVNIAHLQPIVSLIAGVLILIMPTLLNYIVAAFLIVSGVLGLGLLH